MKNRDKEILYRLRNSEGVLLNPRPKKPKLASEKRSKPRKSELQRLEAKLMAAQRQLAVAPNAGTEHKLRMHIADVQRQIEIARMNRKSGLTGRGYRAVSGGLPSLGKRK